MYLFSCGIIGAFFGMRTAKKRNGGAADIAQYGATYGILFALIGLILTIIAARTGILPHVFAFL